MRVLYGYILVFLGAGVGGSARHLANQVTLRAFGPNLPVGTVFVNVVGSLCIGMLAGYFAFRGHGQQQLQLFLTTGVLGGFTTFSAFSLEAALLWERGQLLSCFVFVAVSVILSIAAVFAGLALARWSAA